MDEPPFVFYYYRKGWGFGCSKKLLNTLEDKAYRVVIKSRLEPGFLKVGEYCRPGESEDTFVLCAHLCHPYQVNDGLSGVVTGLAVMEELSGQNKLRYTYRLLIIPENIGSVAWLSNNEYLIPHIKGGLFLEMTGLKNPPALQMSYFGNTQADACLRHVHLKSEAGAWYAPYRSLPGNDERQFNAPGVRIPMLSYSRALPRENPLSPYKEYHSAADNLEIVSEYSLEKSKETILEMIKVWENNYYPLNLFRGEVFLSGAGIAIDRNRDLGIHRNMLMIIDMIDGSNSIIDIAERLKLPFDFIKQFVDQLHEKGLVELHDRPFIK